MMTQNKANIIVMLFKQEGLSGSGQKEKTWFRLVALIESGLLSIVNLILLYGIRKKHSSSALVPVAIQLINNLNFKFKFA